MGEPNQKITAISGLDEYWLYPSKGLSITITKSTSVLASISAYSSNYYITQDNGTKEFYTNYPYEIGNGWKINNNYTTMDEVIDKLGVPSIKSSGSDPSIIKFYGFANKRMFIGFSGDTEDDYYGKLIQFFYIY